MKNMQVFKYYPRKYMPKRAKSQICDFALSFESEWFGIYDRC